MIIDFVSAIVTSPGTSTRAQRPSMKREFCGIDHFAAPFRLLIIGVVVEEKNEREEAKYKKEEEGKKGKREKSEKKTTPVNRQWAI